MTTASYIPRRIKKKITVALYTWCLWKIVASVKSKVWYFCFLYQSNISGFQIVYDYHCEAERHSVHSHVLWHLKYFYYLWQIFTTLRQRKRPEVINCKFS